MNIQLNDVEKHVLEQAKIEVDHTRSWPPKILAFYVAINLSLVRKCCWAFEPNRKTDSNSAMLQGTGYSCVGSFFFLGGLFAGKKPSIISTPPKRSNSVSAQVSGKHQK